MDFIGLEKKTDMNISDPTVRNEARRYSVRTRLAFLPDHVIGQSWFFRLLTFIYYYFFVFFHAFEVVGSEKIDVDQGCLFIARHSTHNGDILGTLVCFYHMTGRMLRPLIHRLLTVFFPFLRLMGAVPGEPKSASSLLKSGFWVAVIPGGADEGMIGHENAYKVCWPKKRKGFAHVAIEAQVPIVPLFLANVDEMRWNPILSLWNFLGLGRLFSYILELDLPVIRPILLVTASTVWFLVTFIQIPIPAKLTLFIGDPVQYDTSKDSIDDIVERARNDLQALINKRQPYGKSYSNAVKERFECLVRSWKTTFLDINDFKIINMIDNDAMDTTDKNSLLIMSTFDVEKFRLINETDQQWFYRKQFIEAYRFDYNEERLLCLAQCYANTKCLGCKYSEPLKSLLDQLSEKFSTSSIKRPTNQEPADVNIKRISPMSNTYASNVPTKIDFSNTSNFVSFSSSFPSQPLIRASPPLTASIQQSKTPKIDAKAILHESAQTKLTRLQAFTTQLKQSIESAQNRTGDNENDHAIEHIYQIGTQQRLFIDYRPDELSDQLNSHISPANSFLTKTFRGKLYIDDVYICFGEGSNKKLCKRHCFQQALNRFLCENFDINLTSNNDGREQYELIRKVSNNDQEEFALPDDDQEKETFSVPSNHPMANTKMNFVHARDTSTIAGRTARQQSKLEQQYWQQWGQGVPLPLKTRRTQRPLSPPPPVPHQKTEENTAIVIEGIATTPASVAAVIADIEQAAEQHQQQHAMDHKISSSSPFIKPTNNQEFMSAMTVQPICAEAAKNAIDPVLLSQQRAKLAKMQPFLFSLLNTLADASHAIDLISTQSNKYHLNTDFECDDKPTLNGFHGHLIVEQIEIADGHGLNKKLAKKQVYSNALKSISSAKSFSLELRHQIRWTLVCHEDSSGLLKIPPPRRPMALRGEERPSRWGPPTNLSAVTPSSTSAVRHFHERRVEEGSQREREYHTTNGICIPPPALIEPPLTRVDLGKDLSKCTSSTDEAIANNIRRLIPNTFVVFELLDFDENIPGHYVSMLFTSLSKNKLDLKYEFIHVPNGFMITYSINNRFFMSWIAPTKVAAKQMGAKKAIEMLKTLYPSIKTKHVVTDMSMNENEIQGIKCRLIRRAQLYEQSSLATSMTTTNNTAPPKEDMGSKLLKKMGWIGGGIGKDLQGIAEPIQIEDLQGRKGLGSSSLFPNQMFIKNLRQLLEDFITNNDNDDELQFANEFNSEERKTIHKEAMKLHLTSNSYGRDGERRIRITQKRNVDQLVDHLLTHGGETARYELKAQTQPRSITQTLSQRKYGQIAPPSSQWTAPDACDDENL
ncbi:hypothetical protein I4U23_021104 [Adineta vaga]|nr:hypothetical protein I4U23_021104 [Adineta vaga]